MKNDQYIPHEVSTRSNSLVMNLIEAEGMAGYGTYWALLEYLRVQENYVGDLKALKTIKRQMKIRQAKLDRILHGSGLFVCDGNTFYSPKLNELMKPYEARKAKIEAYKQNKEKAISLEISKDEVLENNIVSFEEKGKGKGKREEDTSSPISSSSPSEEAAEAAAEAEVVSVSSVPRWERLVDELQTDQQWLELVAMRSGLKRQFHSLFPRIVECFKRHVRCMGNEGRILSTSDAKHYFFFFLNPSSPTYKNLILELQKPVDKGVYRFEDGHPSTGKRSYCGIPIPDDAPPRPNDQAVWNTDLQEWVF